MQGFIIKHFGSIDACAKQLNVGRSTVYRWLQSNPRGILFYAPEICRDKNTTAFQLVAEVANRVEELENLEPIAHT
jgi:transposase